MTGVFVDLRTRAHEILVAADKDDDFDWKTVIDAAAELWTYLLAGIAHDDDFATP